MKIPHLCLALLVVSSAACKRESQEIKTYKVARETSAPETPAADPHAGMPGMMPGGTAGADPHAGLTAEQLVAAGSGMPAGPEFTDSPPAHWKKLPLTPMLLVKYQIEGENGATVDVTFSTLRSAPGGLLANVNRWRGQLDQSPIDDAALKQNSQTVKTGFGDGLLVEIEGLAPTGDAKKDGRLIGAIAEAGPSAWFFKMRGNSALAAAEKANFIQWIETVKSPMKGGTVDIPTHGTPPGPAVTPPPAAASVAAGDGSLTWQVPDGWTLAPTGASMRYATLNIVGADGAKGEVVVTHFPGDVGGDLANVNRWRQQVALPPVDEAGLAPLISKLTAGPKTMSLIDVTGPKVRCAAGWTRHGAETWFFKFTGPDTLVGTEKAKFTAFLESIRFTKPE